MDQLHLIPLLALSLYLAASVMYARACFTRSEVSFAPAQLMVRSAFFLHALFVVALYRLKVPGEAITLQFPTALVLSSFLLVGFFITFEKRARLTALGAILSPLAIVAMTISSVAFHLDRGEGLEANLTSVLTAHILTSVVAHTVFFISFAFSLALIVHRSLLKRRRLTKLQRLLPPLERLDQFNATAVAVGFIFMSLGVGLGVLYAGLNHVTVLTSDARLVWSFLILGVYAGIVAMRFLSGVRGARVAWFSVVGFSINLLSFVVVNFFSQSFHVF